MLLNRRQFRELGPVKFRVWLRRLHRSYFLIQNKRQQIKDLKAALELSTVIKCYEVLTKFRQHVRRAGTIPQMHHDMDF